MNILVCAGGTGGGIYPALAAVSELDALGVPKDHILWIGVKGEMEEKLIPRAGITLERIVGGPIAGVSPFTQLWSLTKLSWSTIRSWFILNRFKPDAVLLTGGYMAVPVALAARARGIPSMVFLPDIEPGSAIKAISRHVNLIAATFEASADYFSAEKPLTATGYPLRPELVEAGALSKEEAVAHFGLDPELQTLFVFGGSRGAWSINQALMAALPELLEKIQIIHISGTLTAEVVQENADSLTDKQKERYRLFPYLHEEMGIAFRAADLVVARAGASMLGEAPLFGVPTILVPYPHAWRYQKINADYLANRGAALVLQDEQMEERLKALVLEVMDDRVRLQEMSQVAHALHTPNAAKKLAETLVSLGRQGSLKRTGQHD